jgi:hypothetical protein
MVLVLVVALAAGAAMGADRVPVNPKTTTSAVINNLMIGLNSPNQGLRESAAFELGEQKAVGAVIPLLNMLHQSEGESSRIVAALALCRIGDPRGVYAVKRAAKFDPSQKVRTLCAWFVNTYAEPGSFEFVKSPKDEGVELGSR